METPPPRGKVWKSGERMVTGVSERIMDGIWKVRCSHGQWCPMDQFGYGKDGMSRAKTCKKHLEVALHHVSMFALPRADGR